MRLRPLRRSNARRSLLEQICVDRTELRYPYANAPRGGLSDGVGRLRAVGESGAGGRKWTVLGHGLNEVSEHVDVRMFPAQHMPTRPPRTHERMIGLTHDHLCEAVYLRPAAPVDPQDVEILEVPADASLGSIDLPREMVSPPGAINVAEMVPVAPPSNSTIEVNASAGLPRSTEETGLERTAETAPISPTRRRAWSMTWQPIAERAPAGVGNVAPASNHHSCAYSKLLV